MAEAPVYVPFALSEAHAMAALGAVRFALTMAKTNAFAEMPEMKAKIAKLGETETAMVESIQRAGFAVV